MSIDLSTAKTLVEAAKTLVEENSNGQLTNLTAGSPISAILEAQALMTVTAIEKLNNLASEIENTRIAYLDIDRQQGKAAVGTVRAVLTGAFAETFSLPAGFQFNSEGQIFTTTAPLTIPPYSLSGIATAIAEEEGVSGNVSGVIAFSPVPRLSALEWETSPDGGTDAQSDDTWEAEVRETIRRRTALVSEDDFETVATNYLGDGSVAVAIGRLKPDGITYENGYVSVFARNPDGTALSTAQNSYLESYYNRQAAIARVSVQSINTIDFNCEIFAGYDDTANTATLRDSIEELSKTFLAIGNLTPGALIFPKALERRIMLLSGVQDGNVTVTFNNLAQPLAMPNNWTIGRLAELTINLFN